MLDNSNEENKSDIILFLPHVSNDIGDGYDKSFDSSNGRHYHLYNQNDTDTYSLDSYSGVDWSTTIGWYGCGVVSLTSILTGHGYNKHPGQIVEELKDISTKYVLGSIEQLISQFEYYGFNVEHYENIIGNETSINQSVERLKNHLLNGGEAVLLSSHGQSIYNDNTYGYKTNSGHYVCVLGISIDEKSVYISDSKGNDGWSIIEDLFNTSGTRTSQYILVSRKV